MDSESIEAARALLPPSEPPPIYADWAASALPLPLPPTPAFLRPAHASTSILHGARRALREFLGDSQDKYHVVLTSGATAALQLVAHRLPWGPEAVFYCHNHAHNAVLGIRNVAVAHGANFCSLSSLELEAMVNEGGDHGGEGGEHGGSFAVLAFPGQCNMTGSTYPLHWARAAKRSGLRDHPAHRVVTLVDTAKLAASAPLHLDAHPDIDAVVFSLYKLCASYTGLGALLVRKGSLLEFLLSSTAGVSYFGGGASVRAVTPRSLRLFEGGQSLVESLEVGTPNMQAVTGLQSVLQKFSPPDIVMKGVEEHARKIGALFVSLLESSFAPGVVRVHRDMNSPENLQSSVVAFTLHYQSGISTVMHPIGHQEIFTILSVNNVHARAGCVCNAGACASVLGLTDDDLVANFEMGHRCGDGMDLIRGKPTGVVRVSFGWGSLTCDARAIVRILLNHVSVSVRRPLRGLARNVRAPERAPRDMLVAELFLYPVKSCGGSVVRELKGNGRGGALGDRVFGIEEVTTGKLLNVQTCPELALITAQYSADWSTLILRGDPSQVSRAVAEQICVRLEDCAGLADLLRAGLSGGSGLRACSLSSEHGSRNWERSSCDSAEVSNWLSAMSGKRVRLVPLGDDEKLCDRGSNVLVVSHADLRALAVESGICRLPLLTAAIRPNILLQDAAEWRGLSAATRLCGRTCKIVKARDCTRCAVVNIIAQKLTRTERGEPLRSIARMSRADGRKGLTFGVLSQLVGSDRSSHANTLASEDGVTIRRHQRLSLES